MRDFNFFSYLIKEKKSKNLRYINILLTIGGLAVAMIAIYLINFGIIQKLKFDIEDRKSSINYQSSAEIEDNINEKERELQILKEYETIVTGIDAIVGYHDSIDDSLLVKIASTLPEGVKFSAINISSDVLSITGTSTSRIAVGELEHNFKELKLFSVVHVGSISFDGTNYSFDISCVMVEGENNEDNN